MAAEYAEHDGQFLFVYTREAHPSDRYPGHTSFEQKKSVASEMAKQLGFARPMLVDDLEGTVHHAYGRLPNMTYIVNPGGTIIYRAGLDGSKDHPSGTRAGSVRARRAARQEKTNPLPYEVAGPATE